jgi:hypothetical protein
VNLVANDATYARAPGSPLTIRIADIASDVNGNPVTVQSLGASAQGATLSYDSTNIYYLPANNNYDSFTYTVSNGNETATGTISITVPLPTVTLTTPTNGALFVAPASLTLEAIASSTGATVVQVEFFAGTNSLGVATNSPFVLTATNLSAGVYRLSARATDDLGGVGLSSVVNIVIDQPPVVAILSPTNTARFSSITPLTLQADATDSDGAVARVEFFSGINLLGTVSNSPFNLALSALPAGTYILNARAVDNLGIATVSSSIVITSVPPPTVTLTTPTNGAIFAVPASLTLEAIALSSGATIVQVEFFAGTNALGVATNSPYNLTVSNLEAGVYVVMARATDDLGGKGISNPVNFKVEPAVSIRLTSANRLGNGDFQCSMTGLTSDVSVIVQASTDLIHWTDIATQMVHGTTLTFTDTNAIVFTARYYRVAQ